MLRAKIIISSIILLALFLPPATLASIDIYFSLIDDPEAATIKELKAANQTIDIAMYYFTDRDLASTAVDAHNRGVKVRVYLDKNQRQAKYSKSRYLAKHGIPIRYSDNPYIMYHKFCVIDKKVVITGSYNWTAAAGERNNESLLVIHDKGVAEEYLAEFNRLWSQHYLPEEIEAPKETEVAAGSFKVVAVCFAGNPGGRDEWVAIKNISNKTYNLKGWYIADDDGHEFRLKEAIELGPGETLAITNTEITEVTVPYDKLYCLDYDNYWWNNKGDTVRLLNLTKQVVMEIQIGAGSKLRTCS